MSSSSDASVSLAPSGRMAGFESSGISLLERREVENYLIKRKDRPLIIEKFKDRKTKGTGPLLKKEVEEDRILVISKRGWIPVFQGGTGRLMTEAHIIELTNTETMNPNEIVLKFRAGSVTVGSCSKVNEIVAAIKKTFIFNLPGSPDTRDFEIKPEQIGPCYGFSRTYRCISHYMGVPVRDDICYLVDNIYATNGIKELNFSDWLEPPTAPQAKAMIDALKYNQWFESLVISGEGASKVGNDAIMMVANALQNNKTISKIVLERVGAREAWVFGDTWQGLALNNYLTIINLANNQIEDRGATSLSNEYLANICHPLQALNISNCGITRTGLGTFFKMIKENKWVGKNIKFLAVSGNRLEDGADDLVQFVFAAPSLRQLEVSNANITWGKLRPEMNMKIKESSLTRLDLSGNKLSQGEHLTALAAFLADCCPGLTDLDMADTTFPATPFTLSTVFQSASFLTKLSLAENELDEEGILSLVDVLAPAGGATPSALPNLKYIDLSYNLPHNPNPLLVKKTSNAPSVKALSHLLSPEAHKLCPIESFKFQGGSKGRLKGEILPLIQSLKRNSSLTELDIRGHRAGDELAASLGQLISVNSTLRVISWDENYTTLVGLENFAMGLRRNHTLERMPMPVLDIADYLRLPENSQGMQLLKERLKVTMLTATGIGSASGAERVATIQERTTELIAEFQIILIQNTLQTFKESLKKAAGLKRRNEYPSSSSSSSTSTANSISTSTSSLGPPSDHMMSLSPPAMASPQPVRDTPASPEPQPQPQQEEELPPPEHVDEGGDEDLDEFQ